MKKFLKEHPEIFLACLALLFIATVVGFFTWGTSTVIVEVNRALKPVSASEKSGFDLKAAAGLNLRGLVNSQP